MNEKESSSENLLRFLKMNLNYDRIIQEGQQDYVVSLAES